MNRRSFLAAGAAAATACSRKQQSLTQVRIGVGGAAQLVYLPTTLTQQLGFFAAQGLDVVMEDFPGGAKALQALLGGSVDVVSGFYDHTIQMAAEGKKMVAFVDMLRFPGLALAISPKAKKKVQRIEDAEGLVAGVTAPGSSTHFFINYLLTKRNVALDAVGVTGIGHAASAVAAFESGKVDLAVLTEPALTEIEKRVGALKILADTRTAEGVRDVFGVSQYPASVLYAPQDWLEKNQDTARRLALAVKQTLGWIASHTAKQIAAKMPPEHRGPDADVYQEALVSSMAMFNPNGEMTLEGAEAVRKVLNYSLPVVRDAQIDLAATFTNAFIDSN